MLAFELSRIKYLIIIEIFLLLVFSLFDIIPFFIFLSIILLVLLSYFLFNNPLLGIILLLFSIFAGSLGVAKIGGKTPSIFMVDIVFMFIAVLFFIKLSLNINNEFTIHPIIWLWIAFLIWGTLSFFVAIEKFRALVLWKNYFSGFIVFCFTYYTLKNKVQVKSIIISFIVWGFVLSLIEFKILYDLGGLSGGIVALFFKKNLLATSWGRSNYLAAFFVMIIPLSIGYLLYTKLYKLKIIISVVLILMFSALVITLSRGAFLSLSIALLILFSRVTNKKTLIPLLIAILVVTLIVLLNPLTYVLLDRIGTIESSASYFSRINFYKEVWDTFLQNPITGVGFGNLGLYSQFVIPLNYSTSAHNIILGMLGETGILGAILFLSILFCIFLESIRKYIVENNTQLKILHWSCIASILGVVIHSLMEPNFESMHFSVMIWCLIATNLKLSLLQESDNNSFKAY